MSCKTKIKTGLINFTNCLPLNFSLEILKHEDYELIYGTPAELNKLMSMGEIDVAPISSFEYLRDKTGYILIKTACISSDGECGSVILFSKKNIKELNYCKIGLPCDSATSVAMLKIILDEYGVNPEKIVFVEHKYEQNPDKMLNSGFDAVLFIGDNALKNNLNSSFFTFDIGKLWKELTGYPAVFGSWVARSDIIEENRDKLEKITNIIPKAIEAGLGIYFNRILEHASLNLNLDKELIKDYLTNKIKYSYTVEHERSLELFDIMYKRLQNNPGRHFVRK